MSSARTWLWIIGIIAGVAVALAFGVSLGTLLIVAALLACPIAMYFGMRGMGSQQESAPEPPRRMQRDREARGTLAERDGQQPRPSPEEHTPR